MHTKFWSENLKGTIHLEDIGVDGRIISEWIVQKQDGKVWTAFIYFRLRTSDGLL
jgi:hypothetical protein